MSSIINTPQMIPPKMKLSDIMKQQEPQLDEKSETIPFQTYSTSQTLGKPSLILGDWLYLGNRTHALSKETLTSLEITHILNISQLIPNAWPDTFQYAHINVLDESSVQLYDYFEAAVSFIDLCNPLNYDSNEGKRKILVHCAMGISRSATTTISYLMARSFVINDEEKQILDGIQYKMELYDKAVEPKMNEKICEKHRNKKDYTMRKRKQYQQNEYKNENGNVICNGLTLGEAYLYVLDRRNCICPNIGFCRQLEQWEYFVWDPNDTTLYQLPFFSPLVDGNEVNKNKQKERDAQKPEIESGCQCCVIL